MKNLIIIIVLSLIAITGFYVNRDFWFGWIQKEAPSIDLESITGEAFGYQTLDSIVTNNNTTVFGYQTGALMDPQPLDSAGYTSGGSTAPK